MSEFPQNTANSAAAPRKTPNGIGKLRTTRVADCHARLRLAHGQAVIEDLGSRHGTFVRGERLTGPQRLDDGDEFSLGSVRLTFRVLRAHDLTDTR